MADSQIKSDEIPFEARMLLMQPQGPQILAPVDGFQLLYLFYFQMPFMMKKNQATTVNKCGQKLVTYFGTGLLVGVVTNIQVKRLYLDFLRWPIYARIPIRMGIMCLPFLAMSSFFEEKMNTIMKITEDITRRKNRLLRNGDVEEYFGVKKMIKDKKK